MAALEAEAEGWGQNKRTMVREAESYEVQLTDLLLVIFVPKLFSNVIFFSYEPRSKYFLYQDKLYFQLQSLCILCVVSKQAILVGLQRWNPQLI